MTTRNENSNGRAPQSGVPSYSPRPSRRLFLAGAGGVAAAAALAACTDGGSTPAPIGGSPGGTPKRGGNFRLGVTGGGAKDIIDAQTVNTEADGARVYTAFETLLSRDDNFKLTQDGLAQSVEADNATQYTINLRKGIEFHNGKTLTADDVIYSLRRVGDKANGLPGYSQTGSMDLANLKKVDEYTVRLPLLTPDSTTPAKLAQYNFMIVPDGYKAYTDSIATQVGTGAFKFQSFTPGRESVSERNPNYWREGEPYFDTVTISNFSDGTARLNALLSGQIDAMSDIPTAQLATVKSRGRNVVESDGGFWIPLCMASDTPPFDDPRVRQAFRLIVDRKAMLNQVASGQGMLGNDLTSPYDKAYLSSAPQRERDIDKAKALLKEAGKEGLTVDLYTTDAINGMISVATVFAQQAKDAGVTVNVKNIPGDAYWSDYYIKSSFFTIYWGTWDYLPHVQSTRVPGAVWNETHWPPKTGKGSTTFMELYHKALAEVDETKRIAIEKEMQQIEYDEGGYIIPFFPKRFDGYAANLRGVAPSKLTWGLGNFGHGFRSIWFD